jgi:hypothetical protein
VRSRRTYLVDLVVICFKTDDVRKAGLGESGLALQLWPYVDGGGRSFGVGNNGRLGRVGSLDRGSY